jgi:hypothetical protein
MELFRTLPKATIAVIEGIARGGGGSFPVAAARSGCPGWSVAGGPSK